VKNERDNLERGGGLIRQKRNEQGLTLREVAEDLGITRMYLSEIERGKKGAPDDQLLNIIKTLNLDELELFTAYGRISPKIKAYLLENEDDLKVLYRRATNPTRIK